MKKCMNDTERLDSLANYIYRAQWDESHILLLNDILTLLYDDFGIQPGVKFRQLIDERIGDYSPAISFNSIKVPNANSSNEG